MDLLASAEAAQRVIIQVALVVAITSAFLLAGCDKPQATLEDAAVRARSATPEALSQVKRTSAILVGSTIVWADQRQVRYRQDDSYVTDEWDHAAVDPKVKETVLGVLKGLSLRSVSVDGVRVTYVLSGVGIAPSGSAVSWIVSPRDNVGCLLVPRVDVNGSRSECEHLTDNVYLLLAR